ncbi:MAG: hypothetical protein HRU33_07345 [Rhodobacteraceae bacterium]|nr:hypothetical protein [Paracoccaceae bacterium]
MSREISALQNLTEFFSSMPVQSLGGFFNSSFSSALCGALVGALAASHFAKRSEGITRSEKKLNACNSAAAISLSIFEQSLAFKR